MPVKKRKGERVVYADFSVPTAIYEELAAQAKKNTRSIAAQVKHMIETKIKATLKRRKNRAKDTN